jgi:hypothetical protein
METLALPRKYQTIIVPSSSFQLVLDPEAAKEAMKRFYSHLLPGGWLVMPFMVLWSESTGEPLEEDWHKVRDAERADGLTVRRWVRSRYDPVEKLEHTEDRYELLRDGEVVYTENHKRSPATRWYSQEEAVALYQEAGFQDIKLYKDFTWEPATPDDWIFPIIGVKSS